MINPKDVYLPRDITNNNVCALFLAGLLFFDCIHPWEQQHAKFSVITFIVIIGYFSSCIKARRKIFLNFSRIATSMTINITVFPRRVRFPFKCGKSR